VSYGGPISIAAEGYHYIAYFAKDRAGNFSPRNYAYVYIDKTAPVTAAVLTGTLVGGVYDTAVQVTLNRTDNLSGVISTSYQLDGGALTTYSAPITVSSIGSHNVKFYSTDYAGNTEATKTVTFAISAPTVTSLAASPNPAVNGQTITLTAHIAAGLGGTPTGTVTFKNGATTLGSSAVSGGNAVLNITTLPYGNNTLTASYSGAANILPSTSAGLVEVFHQKTTTTLASSLNPSLFAQPVTFTATVTPSVSGVPTGSVQFYNGATLLGTVALVSGKATLTSSTLPVAADAIKAVYLGGGIYASSTSPILTQTVKKGNTATTLVSSLNPSTIGQSVTFTATVTSTYGVPTGPVTFAVNGTTVATVALSGGHATYTTTSLTPGTHLITATYPNSTNYYTSTSAVISEVTKAAATTTHLVSSHNPATHATSVTFTATVTAASGPTPTGTVAFKDGATIIGTGTLNASGVATFSTSTLAVGTHSVTAVYNATANDLASTSAAVSQVIN
jgi:hypothetical protein